MLSVLWIPMPKLIILLHTENCDINSSKLFSHSCVLWSLLHDLLTCRPLYAYPNSDPV